MIVIELSKTHALDADPDAMQQINITGNTDRDETQQCFLLWDKLKKLFFDFLQENVRLL